LVSDQFVELDGMYIDDLEVVMLGAHGVDSGYVDTIGTTEDTTTGVKNLNRQSFVVFPNPADKSLIIQQSSERQLHIQVYDMAGRMLEEQKTMNGKLDTSALPNGVYLIRISDERSTETHRISVLH
ncbi:MAG: T9SS type A sorting domain-containing protein, partial [Salibacteraceae bacterium]